MISKSYMVRTCLFYLHAFQINWLCSKNKVFQKLKFWYIKTIPTTFVFLGCNNGYFGPLCSQKCPYPSFGKECQKICKCENKICDHRQGCKGMYHLRPSDVALICTWQQYSPLLLFLKGPRSLGSVKVYRQYFQTRD